MCWRATVHGMETQAATALKWRSAKSLRCACPLTWLGLRMEAASGCASRCGATSCLQIHSHWKVGSTSTRWRKRKSKARCSPIRPSSPRFSRNAMFQLKRALIRRVHLQSGSGVLRIEVDEPGPWRRHTGLILFGAMFFLFVFIEIVPWRKLVVSGESVADNWLAFAFLLPFVLVPLFCRGLCLSFEKQKVTIEQGRLTFERRSMGWTRTVSAPLAQVENLTIKYFWPKQLVKCVSVDLQRKTYSVGYEILTDEALDVVGRYIKVSADRCFAARAFPAGQ